MLIYICRVCVTEAEKVMEKQVRSFKGNDIEISYYFPFLDGDEEYMINLPESKKMLNMDKNICRFVLKRY